MLYSIHLLRFIAALGVVIQHAFPVHAVNLGAAGVDIFFVISGFVIGYSLPEHETSWQFAQKRFLRVIPMYWLATAIYARFRWDIWKDPTVNPITVLHSLFLIPDGSEPHWVPIYFPAWTLVYEMLFYLIFAVLLLKAPPKECRRYAVFIMAALASLTFPSLLGGRFFENDLFLEFAFGLTACEFHRSWGPLKPAAGAACLILALIGFLANPFGPAVHAISWGIPAVLMIVGLLSFEEKPFFRQWFCVLGGHASYSIYLFHIFIMESISVILFRLGYPDWPALNLTHVFQAICAIAGGIIIHLLFERPLLKFSKMLSRKDAVVFRPL